MSLTLHQHPDKTTLDQALVAFVSEQLQTAIDQRDKASLVVSGGSTPTDFFQQLSQQPLNWSKVIITLADERCVPATDDRSNAKMVQDLLLQNQARAARFIPMFVTDESIEDCRQRLQRVFANNPFDVVILGMGGDGHTASIFPEAAERDQALDLANDSLVLTTDPVTVTPDRITFTRKALLNSRQLLLHFTGDSKWQIFEQAQAKPQGQFPISYFIHQDNLPLQVFFSP